MREYGRVLIILCVIAASFFGPVCLADVPAIAWSVCCLLILSLATASLSASVLYKGLGDRAIGSVLGIYAVGTTAMIAHFAAIYRWTGLKNAVPETKPHGFYDAFYFSVVTWTSLGYGDILPETDSRIFVIVEVLLGYLLMALLISIIVASISHSETRNGQRRSMPAKPEAAGARQSDC